MTKNAFVTLVYEKDGGDNRHRTLKGAA